MKNIFKDLFVNFFPFVVVFSYSLFIPYDSDIGWHIKYGEYFFNHYQVLRENIFSTMMPGYPWINSSWATDLVTYITFSDFGFLGISILGALVVTATLYFFSRAAKLSLWEKAILFPVILYLEKPFIEVSFRGQQLTLLAFGILYYLFSLYDSGKKRVIWLTIPLFLLWSNFHGQFLLGLGIFFLILFFYLIQKLYFERSRRFVGRVKKSIPKGTNAIQEGKYLGLIFILSFLATLINPFGIGIYLESMRHFANPLQKFIIEWLPFDRYSLLWWNLMFWEAIVVISLGITLIRKNFFKNIHYIIPVILLLILSVQVRRYTWVLLLVSIPIVKIVVSILKPRLEEISGTLSSLILIFFYGYIVLVKVPQENLGNLNWDRFCSYTKCSPKSAEFLKNYKIEGKLMTFYNWGGWLIANYPEIPVSIDGRMHLWVDQSGYSAFLDYYPYEQNRKDIDVSDYDVVYMPLNKPIHKRLTELVEAEKWKIAYSDGLATVFVRVKESKN